MTPRYRLVLLAGSVVVSAIAILGVACTGETVSIAGVVVDTNNGPVDQAWILASIRWGQGDGPAETQTFERCKQTDADGTFVVTETADFAYSLDSASVRWAKKAGYRILEDEPVPVTAIDEQHVFVLFRCDEEGPGTCLETDPDTSSCQHGQWSSQDE